MELKVTQTILILKQMKHPNNIMSLSNLLLWWLLTFMKMISVLTGQGVGQNGPVHALQKGHGKSALESSV